MPDISMCGDSTCPSAYTCHRNALSGTKPSEYWQTYSAFDRQDKQKCDSYWEKDVLYKMPLEQ